MADDVELENPSKKARLDDNFEGFVSSDRAAPDTKQYSTIALDDADFTNQRNVGEGGQTDDEHPETSKSSADPARDSDNDSSVSGLSNLSGLSGEESWKPVSGPMSWVYRQMSSGMDPKAILKQIIPHETQIPDLDDLTLWKLIINIVCEPPPRTKLDTVNTLGDVVHLMKTCKNIMVLTGAGVSVSCGIPDFRSRNGVYARLAADYPDLPDPQAMFDIHYFRNDQRPFFKFAKEIFPGQFEPSKCHKFIRLIEDHGKLLRNYTQNIDTLEQVAGINNVIQCHGSFASATCMVCGHKCTADDIKANIMDQVIPFCPRCPPDTPQAVMKPDIVFFGESLPEEFHNQMAADKEVCDLLIVIGSSLKVRPVALIPNSLPPKVPQILINKEPLKNLNFDVELLGDCDTIVGELCRHLGEGWYILSKDVEPLTEVAEDQLLTPPATPTDDNNDSKMASEKVADNANNGEGECRTAERSETGVNSSGIDELNIQTNKNDNVIQGKAGESEMDTVPDSNCKCADNNVTYTAKLVADKNGVEKGGTSMECSTNETSFTSETNKMTAENNEAAETKTAENNVAAKNKTADDHVASGNIEVGNYNIEDSISESKNNNAEVSEVGQSELPNQDVQSSEHKQSQESDNLAAMEGESEEVSGTRRTHTCSTSSVCYGDKDTCGCSSDIEELRKMWKPAVVRCSVSKRLGANQYCFMPPSRYVFPEAEVYTVLEDSDSECDSDSDKDDLDDLSDIDGNSDPLNTSEEQMDKNNSCSDQDGMFCVSNPDPNNIDLGEIIPDTDNVTGVNVANIDKITGQMDNESTGCQLKTDTSQQNNDKNPLNEIQPTFLTTSNELSDSLIDNMDHFAKIVTDQDSTEVGSQDFNIDFEGT